MGKHFTPVVGALRTILPLCLLCTCLSLRAQPVTGHASGGGQLDPNDSTRSSYTPLPVGPAGGGGTAINPNDYGMCGVQSLAGAFDRSTVAQIVVVSGYYHVYRRWPASQIDGPTVVWTCVRFSQFTGVPPSVDAGTFLPPTKVTAASGVLVKDNSVGGFTQACVWAGLAGSLSATPAGEAGYVSAQYDGETGNTLVWAQSTETTTLSTYAFCNTYKVSPPFWRYQPNSTPSLGTGPTFSPISLGISPDHYWCYMDGVGTTIGGTFTSAGLSIGPTSYNQDVGKGSWMWYNCLPFSQ